MVKAERIQHLHELAAEQPSDPFAWYALTMEMEVDELDHGVKLWANFQDRFPDYLPAYYLAGQANVKAGQIEEAIQIWTAGLELAKNQNNTHTLGELKSAIMNATIALLDAD